MDVTLSEKLFETLKATPEMPESIATRLESARTDGGDRIFTLSEDERMAMEEMCQWHVMKDPETGELTPKAVLYDNIINAIYDADLE
jgi:hypothetical protein